MPGWKNIIENHPIPVLMAVCISVAGVASGVTGWFWYQSDTLKNLKFENQVTRMKTERDFTIVDLKRRLISIERRVGGKKLYIDVAKIPVLTTALPALHKTHKPFSSGKYYVAPPTFTKWTRTAASQLDFASVLTGTEIPVQTLGSLGPVLSEKIGTLWKGDKSIVVNLPSTSLLRTAQGIKELKLTPFVFAMPVDQSLIQRTMKAMGGLVTSFQKKDKGDLRKVTKSLSDILRSLKTESKREVASKGSVGGKLTLGVGTEKKAKLRLMKI